MDNQTLITIVSALFIIVSGLIGIIYANLNTKTKENSDSITDIKERYATKEDVKEHKSDQEKKFDRLEKKLDKIITMLMEGKQ